MILMMNPKKYSQEDGGDSFVVSLASRAGQSAWMINPRVSFHMTSHQHWILVYEKDDGEMV
jgi:hypothetical protein